MLSGAKLIAFTFSPLLKQPSVLLRAMSSQSYKFLAVTKPHEFVTQVSLNRPEKRNALHLAVWDEIGECFSSLATDPDTRVIVLNGAGKAFCAGIDLLDFAGGMMQSTDTDVGRRALQIRKLLKRMQQSFTALEQCPKPVIASIHGPCVGAGVDLISACDIRYCSQDAWFQIKEVEIGLAADVGTLQRVMHNVGNESIVRELIYTSRQFYSDEAKQFGLVTRVFPDNKACLDASIELAAVIAAKSPIAVQGSKVQLNYARDHSVADSLEYISAWNMSMLQSEDLVKAATAALQKTKATFSKL